MMTYAIRFFFPSFFSDSRRILLVLLRLQFFAAPKGWIRAALLLFLFRWCGDEVDLIYWYVGSIFHLHFGDIVNGIDINYGDLYYFVGPRNESEDKIY